MKTPFFLLLFFPVILWQCSKESEDPYLNPYDNPALLPPIDTSKKPTLEKGSFQYLYQHIFYQTCANSGCHDGNFEPDFRTIYSAYNTLVNHPVIKNNASNTFKFRVDPGHPETSVIIERLTRDIDGQSGIMPLSVEPESDWPQKKEEYIQMINEWIAAGAPDTYGNLPTTESGKPQVVGIMAFPSGNTTTPLLREDNKSNLPILIGNDPIDVWFAFSDDDSSPSEFKLARLKNSKELYDFSSSTAINLAVSSPIPGNDFWNNPVNFTHKATLVFSTDTVGTYLFLRTYLQDKSQTDTTEIPNNGTNDIMRAYFTLKVDSL